LQRTILSESPTALEHVQSQLLFLHEQKGALAKQHNGSSQHVLSWNEPEICPYNYQLSWEHALRLKEFHANPKKLIPIHEVVHQRDNSLTVTADLLRYQTETQMTENEIILEARESTKNVGF